jgi:hypothetical protein
MQSFYQVTVYGDIDQCVTRSAMHLQVWPYSQRRHSFYQQSSVIMPITILELRAQLIQADICYYQPTELDFASDASLESLALDATPKNLGIIVYRTRLQVIRDMIGSIVRNPSDLNEAIEVAMLQASILTKLNAIKQHIQGLFLTWSTRLQSVTFIIIYVCASNCDLGPPMDRQ